MSIINVTCSEIQTPVGFVFVILPLIMNQTNNLDCDQSWYLEDGSLIADPLDPQSWTDPVISVSSDRLVTSRCVNLNHQIICHSNDGTPFIEKTAFRVRNQTAVTPNSGVLYEVSPSRQPSDQCRRRFPIIIALLLLVIISILISILIYLSRRRMLRCFQKSDHHYDIEYSENRDPEADVQQKL